MELRKHPDPILKEKCEPIPKITNEIRQIAKQMHEIMDNNGGCGLAANQVGLKLRLVVMRLGGKKYTLFNPKVLQRGNKTQGITEACLSLPGEHVWVSRPTVVKLSYQDHNGKKTMKTFTGFEATCVQHELEHLEGITLLDHKK